MSRVKYSYGGWPGSHAPRPSRRTGGERGSAAIISLTALVLISMMGGMFLVHTRTELQITGHHQRYTQALFNAEAGYAEALARLSCVADTTNYIGPGTDWQAQPGWGRHIVRQSGTAVSDPEYDATLTDGLDNDNDGQIDEQAEHYPELLTRQSGQALDYPWVRIGLKLTTSDQVILFGDHDSDITTPPTQNLSTGEPVLVVTARGRQGTARRTLEIETVRVPLDIVHTAAYTESDDFKFNGTQFLLSGRDWDPVTGAEIIGNPEVPGIVTTENPANIAGELNHQQQNNVEGDGAEPSIMPATVDLDLQAMAAQLGAMAELTMPGGVYTGESWGGLDDYTIVRSTGSLDLSGNNNGGGILIVEGDFSCTGQFTWYGLILVLGEIHFTGGGAGIHLYGSILAEGGISQNVMGGNADIKYSSIALARIATLFPYVVASWKET